MIKRNFEMEYNISNISTPSAYESSSDITRSQTYRNVTSSPEKIHSTTDFYIGLTLACSSSMFIGASFILKKKGLLNLSVRAGEGGFGYLKEPLWWGGLIMMGAGEAANSVAYAFAPASLVTPLGALSVIVAAILSSKFLNERLNLIGKVGCLLCVVGSVVIIIHAPEEQNISSMQELAAKLIDPVFVVYLCLAAVVTLVFIFYLVPKMGQTNLLVYITICSVVGSFSVMGVKGVGLAITQSVRGDNQFANWLTYLFIAILAVCISTEMIYFNKALDTFNTSVITPIHYVFFTTCTIIASAILFKEWGNMDFKGALGNICGFITVVGGIFLLNAFKEMTITWREVTIAAKKAVTKETVTPNSCPDRSETHQLLDNGVHDEHENEQEFHEGPAATNQSLV